MSAAYTVVTITADVAKWLRDRGIELTSDWRQSRYPTPAEITFALQQLPEYASEYHITRNSWSVTVSESAYQGAQRWASLVVHEFSGDESVPHKFYFETGWPEVMTSILRALARYCGPLVMINHSDISEIVVAPGPDRGD